MALVMQVLFTLPPFQQRYAAHLAVQHWTRCTEFLPASCLECQMHKISDGLVPGRYSCLQRTDVDMAQNLARASTTTTTTSAPQPVFKEGVWPVTFKALVRRGHAKFATMQQQDAEEFFMHLLTLLRCYARSSTRWKWGAQTDRDICICA